MRLNKKYSNHGVELGAIVAYLLGDSGAPSENATRLGISAAEIANLGELKTAFDTAYSAYCHPDTHNTVAVHRMKAADDGAYSVILPLRQRLKNGLAQLTAEDYANLGIYENKKTRTHSKIPVVVLFPVLLKTESLHLVFEARTHSGESAHRYAVPKDGRIAREIAIVAQGTILSESDFHAINSIGRSRFGIPFAAAQIGMNVYLRIAGENRAGRGPFSPPVKAIII